MGNLVKPILVEKWENLRHGDKIIWFTDDNPRVLTFVDDDYDKCYFYEGLRKDIVEISKKSYDFEECIYHLGNHKEYIHEYLQYTNFFMLKSYKLYKQRLDNIIKEMDKHGFDKDQVDEYLK